ncbi:MAG: hypothetical protein CMN76_02485 [Spirochaetaceae bacterium]|nr:hypothetical protein [Spirochaetaceae bacterium]
MGRYGQAGKNGKRNPGRGSRDRLKPEALQHRLRTSDRAIGRIRWISVAPGKPGSIAGKIAVWGA